MDNNELLNELDKPETKKIMNDIINENIKKEKKRKEKMEILMNGIEYIEWLIDFTKDKEGFTDEDWDYAPIKLNDSDREKVDDLSIFFEGIYNYAKNNYIYSFLRPLGECYHIKIGNIGFEIGYMTGQGTMFYCKRVEIEDNFIDFMDILYNKKQDNVEYIEDELICLSSMIIRAYNNGVPIEALTEIYNKAMKEIRIKEREKVIKKI